jgi:hypothetical protein
MPSDSNPRLLTPSGGRDGSHGVAFDSRIRALIDTVSGAGVLDMNTTALITVCHYSSP